MDLFMAFLPTVTMGAVTLSLSRYGNGRFHLCYDTKHILAQKYKKVNILTSVLIKLLELVYRGRETTPISNDLRTKYWKRLTCNVKRCFTEL